MEAKGKKKSSGMLAPGFRFHPTDEELVRYYLRRKICRKSFRFDAISEIDIYKAEPWDLPSKSRLKSRDLEWYFFSVLDKKYGNGARTNRATEMGYWKTTGKDRAVYHRTEIVGMKKTLVYHSGRAPKGQRTNWVMHEYRLTDLELERVGIAQEAFVLCRVFQKSGSGPKNGEQYGAPFVEEEWEDDELEMDELEMVPKEEAAEEVDFADDIYLDSHDLEQILGSDFPSDTVPAALSVHSAVNSHGEETTDSVNNTQDFSVCADKQPSEPEYQDYNNFYNMPPSFDMDVKAVKHEYIGESSNSGNSEDLDYLLDEPFMDASDNLKYGDGGFIEANDLSNPIEADTSAFDMLEEYLTFFDTNDGDMQYLTYDSEVMPGSANPVSDKALLPQKELNEVTDQDTLPSGAFIDKSDDDVALPSDKQELAKYESDFQHPFIKQASQMLGSIPAPPAFAAEFPSKDAVLRLNSSHVTAGMVQIRNLNVGGNGTDMAFGKDANFNVILSFGLARGDDGTTSLESSVSLLSGKSVSTITTISRSWFYFMFLWVLIISMSFKIGTYICSN